MKEKEKRIPFFKNVTELKEALIDNHIIAINGDKWPTEDGEFIFINSKFIRLDRQFVPVLEGTLVIPECNFEPIADKALLWHVKRHTQFYPDGTFATPTHKVDNANKTAKIEKQRERYFIVKAGKNFSLQVTGEKEPLVLGDEVVLADYVDGLAELPRVEDPTGYILNDFISLHYTEIQGYVRHTDPLIKQQKEFWDSVKEEIDPSDPPKPNPTPPLIPT